MLRNRIFQSQNTTSQILTASGKGTLTMEKSGENHLNQVIKPHITIMWQTDIVCLLTGCTKTHRLCCIPAKIQTVRQIQIEGHTRRKTALDSSKRLSWKQEETRKLFWIKSDLKNMRQCLIPDWILD